MRAGGMVLFILCLLAFTAITTIVEYLDPVFTLQGNNDTLSYPDEIPYNVSLTYNASSITLITNGSQTIAASNYSFTAGNDYITILDNTTVNSTFLEAQYLYEDDLYVDSYASRILLALVGMLLVMGFLYFVAQKIDLI